MLSDMIDFTPAFGSESVCTPNNSSGKAISPLLPFRPHSDPTVRQFVGIPEGEYEGIEHEVDPTEFVVSAANGVFPLGAEVQCYWSEDDNETYEAIVTMATDEAQDAVDFSDYGSFRVHVTFLDDTSNFWLPSSWCSPAEPYHLWEAGPFLYDILTDEPVAEFHRALRGLSVDFPSAPSTLFSYCSTRKLFDAAEHDTGTDGTDADSTEATSTHREAVWTTVPTWIALYIEEQENSSLSSRRLFQTLPRDLTAEVDNKFLLHENVLESGTAAMAVFPPTYGSIEEALKATEQDPDPNSLFFVKASTGTLGQDIRVLRRSELEGEPEASFPGEVIVQRAVEDLLTVDDDNAGRVDPSMSALHRRRFDIRFFVVVCGGTAYLHSHMYAMWAAGAYDPGNPSVENQVPKAVQYRDGATDAESLTFRDDLFFPEADPSWARRDKSPPMRQTPSFAQFNPAAWRYAIADALDRSRPVLDHLINATYSDQTRFQILGGDAVIQRSGGAVLIEFNDWPEMSFFNKRREKCVRQGVCSRRLVLPDSSAPNGYSVTTPSPLFYEVANGYTTQFLREVASLVMGLEDIAELPRFREIGLNKLE